jgi:hypothetical protein
VDVTARGGAQLLDVVECRDATGPSAWLEDRPDEWGAAIRWGGLDLSGPYRKTFDDTLAHVIQVADPFHLVKLANQKLDECRRFQNATLGHRGRKPDPLYRARRLSIKAHERLDERGETKLLGLLAAGDPGGEVRSTWHAKEVVRSSTTSRTRSSPKSSSTNSPLISKTRRIPSRSAHSGAPSYDGATRSSCGTKH